MTSPTPPSSRRNAARGGLAVVLAAALSLVPCACGEGGTPKAGPGAASAVDPPWYPVRHVFVSFSEKRGPNDKPIPGSAPRTREAALSRAQEIRKRLLEPGASFAEVAKSDSDETTTAGDGGFIDIVSRMTTGFSERLLDALDALPEGAISEPIEERGGFHLLQRLSTEEGRRLEAQTVAVVDGFHIPFGAEDKRAPPGRTKAVAYEMASRAVNEIRTGAKDLDHAFYDAPGAIPFHATLRRSNTKVGFEAQAEAALALGPGEVANPVETPDGWAVLARRPYLRARVRQIVVHHEQSLKRFVPSPPARKPEEAYARAQEALGKVRKDRSAWEAVVRAYSDEEISRARGGSMGEWANTTARGIPGPLEQALSLLAPGEISDIVETPIGFHILWRVD